MTRSIVLACAFALAACSHGTGEGTTPEAAVRIPELPLISLVDPGTPGVLHVDLSRIHETTLYQTASGWLDLVREQRSSDSDLRFVLDLLESREVIVYVSSGSENDPSGVLLLRGRFDDAFVARFEDSAETPPRTSQQGPFTVRHIGSDGAIARIGDHTLVLGRNGDVSAVVERQIAGGNGHLPEAEAFRTLADRVGLATNPIGFVIVPTQAMRDAASGESDAFLSAISAARGLGIGLDPGNGLRGTVVVDLDSNIEAVGLSTLARMQLGSVAADRDVQATGISALLPYFQIDREGTSVIGRLDAPRAALDQSLQTLDGFVRSQLAGE